MAGFRFRVAGVSVGSVVAAGLVVGLAVAAFSVLDTVVLQPLPFPNAAELVDVSVGARGRTRAQNAYASWPDFMDWRARLGPVAQIAAYSEERFPVATNGRPKEVLALIVSSDFFKVLGTAPARGAGWSPAEGLRGAREVVVSSGFRRTALAGVPNVIGSVLQVGGEPYRVTGIMPAGFRYPIGPGRVSLWLSVAASGAEAPGSARDLRYWTVIGQLHPGVSAKQAAASLAAVARGLARAYPATNAAMVQVQVTPAKEDLLTGRAVPIWLGFAATMLVFLVACVNYAGAAWTRAARRRSEVAMRRVLGAGGLHLLAESAAEAALAGVAIFAVGVGAAVATLRAVVALAPANVPRLASAGLDWRVAAFALGCVFLVGCVASLAVLAFSVRVDAAEVIRGGSGAPTRGRSGVVVGVEMALGVMLAAAAAAAVSALVQASRARTGLEIANVSAFAADTFSVAREDQVAFYRRTVAAMRAVPGVTAVAAGTPTPLIGGQIILSAAAGPRPAGLAPVSVHIVTPGYFRALGIRMLRGRTFRWGGGADAIVSRAWVRAHGGGDPVGHQLVLHMQGGGLAQERIIIGEAADVADPSLGRLARRLPSIYVADSTMLSAQLTFLVGGTRAGRAAAVAAFERAAPDVPVYAQLTLQSRLERLYAPARFAGALFAALALTAGIMAIVGVWSLAAMEAGGRRRKVAIRAALGARPASTAMLLAHRALTWSGLGAAAGALLAGATQPALAHWQAGLPRCGPLGLAEIAGALLLVSVAATLAPVVRAARMDPSAVLREG